MNGKTKMDMTLLRFKPFALILLRKLKKPVNNCKRIAKMISTSKTMMVMVSTTGRDFQFLQSSYTHKELGWHGDAKK